MTRDRPAIDSTLGGRDETDVQQKIDDIEVINVTDDLPPVVNDLHQLRNNTAYHFGGRVRSEYGLELATLSPLLGTHRELNTFIHTGESEAIVGTDVSCVVNDIGLNSPNGTIFNISGDQGNEELILNDVFIADDQQLGDIADLGTVSGFRSPEIERVDMRDFDTGLTISGVTTEFEISTCTVRDIDANNVTAFLFDADFEADYVDLNNNFIRNVQSDTVIVNVDPSATINELFRYIENAHDSTVTESNILTGAAGYDVLGYRTFASNPLKDSRAFIDYTLDADATVTINTQANSKTDAAAYVSIPGTTTEQESQRFSHADNLAIYDGVLARHFQLSAEVSCSTGNTDEIALAIFKNGNIMSGSPARVQMNQQGGGVAKFITSSTIDQDGRDGDEYDIRMANLSSTTNITVGELTVEITD